MGAHYVLRFDDVAPNMNWAAYDRIAEVLDACDLRALIGVIPDNQDPDLLRWSTRDGDFWKEIRRRAERGWEVAVHGFQHRYLTRDAGILGLNPRSEFAGLPYSVQREKLYSALAVFRSHRIASETFMPPAHSYDTNTLRALRDVGFRYVTDGRALYPYESGGLVFVPWLFARPLEMPAGIFTTCIHLNEAGEKELVRLEKFIRTHRDDIIDFKQAAVRSVDAVWNRALGRIAWSVLGGVRRGRVWSRSVTRRIRR